MRTIIIVDMKRMTAQRQAIFDLINGSNRHWDAEEVNRELSDRGHSVGIATVYRGLTALDEAGMINSVQLADRKRYERADKTHHDHMVCTECGHIEEFSQHKIEALQEAVAREKGFEMTGHQLILFGLCSDCNPTSKQEGML